MKTLFLLAYNIFFVPLFIIGFRLGSLFNKKIKEGLHGRKNIFSLLKKQVSDIPDNAEIILFHSASVGEWEQAVPIITELKKRNKNIYIVASFFSPSGFRIVKNKHIDLKIYLPIDTPSNARRFFKLLKPKLWIISKYDVWPNFICEAKVNNVPIILASAELAPDSNRYKGIAKHFNKTFYKYFDYILPVSGDYKQRFLNIFPYPERIIVAGDARYDQIYRKTQKVIAKKEKVPVFNDDSGIAFIGGSIWPNDEKHIFPALERLLQKYERLSLILVPHELSESHIESIHKYFSTKGHSVERYSQFHYKNGTDARIAIIDTIGVLFKIYRKTEVAYVGGSFSTGVHNVLEPAAYGQPVVFGPRYKNSFEAREMVKMGCCFTINNEEEAEIIFDKLISDAKYRYERGKEAQNFLKQSLGATDKILKLLKENYSIG